MSNDSEPQLYNLATDSGEKNNLASQHPDKVQKMTAVLNQIRADGRSRK